MSDLKRMRKLTYSCWQGMKSRCYNVGSNQYHNYGGRGISVCDKWRNSFQEFLKDMGLKPDGLSIDRINNDGNYEPGNCRWATKKQQRDNQRTTRLIEIDGVVKTQRDWAKEFGIHEMTVSRRIRNGMNPILALKTPVNSGYSAAAKKTNELRWGTAIAISAAKEPS